MNQLENTIIWWTGAATLFTGAALLAGGIILGGSIIAGAMLMKGTFRLYNIQQNLRWVHQWVAAGKPKRDLSDPSHAKMRPTSAATKDSK